MPRNKYTASQLQGPTPKPESILAKSAAVGMSGLSAVSNLLDLPGSISRDLIAGKPAFDQITTPFTDVNRTSGRDLNRKAGLAGRKDTYGNWAGGLATEIATDPLTYLTLGGSALYKGAGQSMAKAGIKGLEAARIASIASKAGDISSTLVKGVGRTVGPREARVLLTPRMVEKHAPDAFAKLLSTSKANGLNLASQMDSPMGGLGKIWPLGDAGMLGTGQFGQKVARGLDVAGDTVRHFKIPGTDIMPVGDLANLVNRKAGGARSAEAIQTAYHNFDYAKTGAATGTRSLAVKWANQIEAAGHSATTALQQRHWLETGTEPAELKPIFDEMRTWGKEILSKSHELGVPIHDINPRIKAAGGDFTHSSRQITEGLPARPGGGGGLGGKDFNPVSRSGMGRMAWSHGIKGGSASIAKIAMDKGLEGFLQSKDYKVAKNYILDLYGKFDSKGKKNPKGILPSKFITDATFNYLKKHKYPTNVKGAKQAIKDAAARGKDLSKSLAPRRTAKAIVTSLKGMSSELRASGIFGNNPVNDMLAMGVGDQEKIRSAEIALQHILDNKVAKGTGVKLSSVLKRRGGLGLEKGDATGGSLKWLTDRGFDVKAHDVAPEAAKFLLRDHGTIKGGPEEVGAWMKLYDNIANVTKIAFTNLDPIRFNVRNAASGHAANALVDQFSTKSISDWHTLVRGGPIPGAAQNAFLAEEATKRGIQNLDDATATKLLSEMAFAHELTGGHGVANPVPGATGGQLKDLLGQVPGHNPFRWGDVGNKLMGQGGTTWDIRKGDWRGVTPGADKSTWAPLAAGDDISNITESMSRGSAFWALLQKGVHPDEAAKLVSKAQVGYQTRNYTKFENQVLKRLLLFYSFQKGMLPFTLEQLIEHPGGRLAQTLRAMNKARGENELVPQHVAETAAIPVNGTFLGSKEPGTNSYLSGFGMGFEDPAQFAVPSLQNAGMEMLSRSNPLIKAPLEGIFGASTFQRSPGGGGRALEDLDPALGRTLANVGEITGLRTKKTPVRYPGSGMVEQVLSNSPISNLLTKARTVTDPRKSLGAKAMNLFSGVKVTDVSPATQDRELLNRVAQIEKEMGGKTFSLSYIPKDRKDELTDKEKKDLATITELKRLLSERSKGRRKAT